MLGKTLTTPQRLVTGIEKRRRQGRIDVRGGAAVPARHHGRDQHHPGAQRRALRADHHAGLSRHLRDRPRQPAGILQPVLQEARAADRARPALRDHGAHRRPGRGADQARRGPGAQGRARGRRARRAGDRDPVPALVPQSGARAARQADRRAGVPGAVRHRLARAQPGVPRVRAHLDGRRQRLCRAARAPLPDRDGNASRRRRLPRQLPDRAVDRRAVRRRRRAQLLHPHAGIGAGRRRRRHQGAVRQHRPHERHRLRHGRHHRQGRRDLRGQRADDRRAR